ncbi:hypothetical protein EDB19DRAFT_1674483 [Suillus lakei]|nr:hypothetical protein EDB19DRAFT_1674483 [Suillus lakei]
MSLNVSTIEYECAVQGEGSFATYEIFTSVVMTLHCALQASYFLTEGHPRYRKTHLAICRIIFNSEDTLTESHGGAERKCVVQHFGGIDIGLSERARAQIVASPTTPKESMARGVKRRPRRIGGVSTRDDREKQWRRTGIDVETYIDRISDT